jgi:hypothetical protein
MSIIFGAAPEGLGQRYARITAWLDENCGLDGWAITPSGTRGVLNDALSIYFGDATLVHSAVVRWLQRRDGCGVFPGSGE